MCRRKEEEIQESRWNHNVRIIMQDRQATAAHESLLLLHISRLVFSVTVTMTFLAMKKSISLCRYV